MKVLFEPAARIEFVEAIRWYADKAGQHYATEFRNEVHRALTLLREHPTLGSPARNDTRSMVVHRYPFNIIYRVQSEILHVLAVAHQRRRPGYWVGRR